MDEVCVFISVARIDSSDEDSSNSDVRSQSVGFRNRPAVERLMDEQVSIILQKVFTKQPMHS